MADRNKNGLYIIMGVIVVVFALAFLFLPGTEIGTASLDPVEADTAIVVDTDSVDLPAVGVEEDSPPAVESPAEPLAPRPDD